MYGGFFELWECGRCDGGGNDDFVRDVENFGSLWDRDGGTAVAVGFGGEAESGGDGCAVRTGPGNEVLVFGRCFDGCSRHRCCKVSMREKLKKMIGALPIAISL